MAGSGLIAEGDGDVVGVVGNAPAIAASERRTVARTNATEQTLGFVFMNRDHVAR
jgi:hypothetical protein